MNRAQLTSELHARSILPLKGQYDIQHFAFAGEREGGLEYLNRLRVDDSHFHIDPLSKYEVFTLNGVQVRWEQHTEFFTATFYEETKGTPFGETSEPLRQIADQLNLSVLVDMRVSIKSKDQSPPYLSEALLELFNEASLCGIRISGGDGSYFSDFRLHGAEGATRHLILDHGMTPFQLGRQVTRIIEIETYRVLAMVGYQHAQFYGKELLKLEQRTQTLISMVASQDQEEYRTLLDEVTLLSSLAEHLIAECSFRLNITEAYATILYERIDSLRGDRIGRLRDLAGFMERRFTPSIRSVKSFGDRLDRLVKSLDRASNLIRTRVDVRLEEQNSQLLRSMDRRAKLQLRLQNTVEGLSVIALSYYSVGLLSYLLTPLGKIMGFEAKILSSSLAIPVIFLIIWRMKKIHSVAHMRNH